MNDTTDNNGMGSDGNDGNNPTKDNNDDTQDASKLPPPNQVKDIMGIIAKLLGIEDEKEEPISKDLENMLNETFGEVKNVYSRAPVNGPEIIKKKSTKSGKGTALFNFMNRTVSINAHFVEELAQDGKRDKRKIAKGLYSHEFGHYMLHPYTLSLALRLSYEAVRDFGNLASNIYRQFVDFENNHLIHDRDLCRGDLQELLAASYEVFGNNPLNHTIWTVYNESMNLGLKIDFSVYDKLGDYYVSKMDPQELASLTSEEKGKLDERVEKLNQKGKEIKQKIETAITGLRGEGATPEERKGKGITIKSPVDYADKTEAKVFGLQYAMLHRFGNAIKPLLELEDSEGGDGDGSGEDKEGEGDGEGKQGEGGGEGTSGGSAGKGSGKGKGKPKGFRNLSGNGSSLITPEDVKNLPQDLKAKVEEALRELLKNLPPDYYDKIKRHFMGEPKQHVDPQQGLGIGLGSADISPAERRTVEIYKDAAKAFGIYIRPKRALSISKVNIPFGQREFRTTDSAIGLDTRFSGPRILPGLTKTRRYEPVPYPATKETIPRLLLYKDSSGSMHNPNDLSHKCYGTVAGGIFLLSYLGSGSEVGVAIFDSETSSVVYSLEEDELFAALCSYKGGGTVVDMEKLTKDLEEKGDMHLPLARGFSMKDVEELKKNPVYRAFLKQYEKKVARISTAGIKEHGRLTDFVIISDGGIANIEELLGFFKAHEEYRPTILHTGSYEIKVPGYDGQTSGIYGGVNILKAETRDDIIRLTHGLIENNLLATYHV